MAARHVQYNRRPTSACDGALDEPQEAAVATATVRDASNRWDLLSVGATRTAPVLERVAKAKAPIVTNALRRPHNAPAHVRPALGDL